jgi:hypothetical protein
MLLTLPEWASKGILFSAICSALRFHTTKTHKRHSPDLSALYLPDPCRNPVPAFLAESAYFLRRKLQANMSQEGPLVRKAARQASSWR